MKNNYSKSFLKFSSLFFSLLFTHENLSAKTASPAADCGCSVTLKPAPDGGIYASGVGVKPGDKVCITAGTYKYINLSNFHGTAQARIQIVNCGGQVLVTGNSYGMVLNNSSFFTMAGTGTAGVPYGFRTSGGSAFSQTGVGITTCTDFTLDHIEVDKTSVGIFCKKTPTCDPSTWQAAFTMRNLVFSNLYVHDISGEGFYVGSTSSVSKLTCEGRAVDAYSQLIRGLKIFNCRVESTGWDGIQVASTPEDAQIYNNTVNNYGTKNQSSQQAGILLGGMTTGKVYNNYIANGTGNGIQVLGAGYIQINNNLVVNVGGNNVVSNTQDGIMLDDRPIAGYPAPYYTVCNNTVVRPKRSGIRLENTHRTITTMSHFHNNLVVASGEPNSGFTTVVIRNNTPNSSTGNLYLSQISGAKFVSTDNYHLSSSSPAVDAGVSVSSWVSTDKDGLSRSMGAGTDVGAYEYPGTATPGSGNQLPVASAGVDRSMTLPTNTVTLSGNGTDEDGSVTRYAWTKIAGPSQIVIANATTPNPQLSSLVVGTYTIRLTVTDNQSATSYDDLQVVVNASSAESPSAAQPIPGTIQGETYAAMSGIKIEKTKDAGGGANISWVHKNDWMDYYVNVAATGTYTLNLRVASYVNTGQIQVRKGTTVLTTISVPNTGGYQTWRTISTTVSLQAGVQTLRLYAGTTGAWSLNWFSVTNGTTGVNSTYASTSMTMEDASTAYSSKVPEPGFSGKASFGVYPNPVTTNLTLQVNNGLTGVMKVQIVDISGRVSKELRFSKNQQVMQLNLPANELSAGTYFINVQIGDYKTSKKIIKL